MLGGTAEAELLVSDLRVDDFDAIVFVGGPGAREYVDSPVALDIVREAADKGKVLAAICIAPVVFANAGVLNGVRATSFPTERIRLQLAGAEFTGAPVERDGPIITASEPQVAALFGKAIVDTLTGR
jgi:protease I